MHEKEATDFMSGVLSRHSESFQLTTCAIGHLHDLLLYIKMIVLVVIRFVSICFAIAVMDITSVEKFGVQYTVLILLSHVA